MTLQIAIGIGIGILAGAWTVFVYWVGFTMGKRNEASFYLDRDRMVE